MYKNLETGAFSRFNAYSDEKKDKVVKSFLRRIGRAESLVSDEYISRKISLKMHSRQRKRSIFHNVSQGGLTPLPLMVLFSFHNGKSQIPPGKAGTSSSLDNCSAVSASEDPRNIATRKRKKGILQECYMNEKFSVTFTRLNL